MLTIIALSCYIALMKAIKTLFENKQKQLSNSPNP